ncbi:hypothetical protein AUR65_018710 [Haloferax marisrubri]|uniref:Uncharacterized protein n=1 Tax=Haloferax marisrubri TaxID=1544719 RepID=A0A2P4NL00_9EURY|nr:hypothetical protein AUR65_018710 [Haloferax marisrubri]
MADANTEKIVRMRRFEHDDDSEIESAALCTLHAQLDERRYKNRVIIFPSELTVSMLRSRFIESRALSYPTLRGFRWIAIASLARMYFDESSLYGWEQRLSELHTGCEGSAKRLWELFVEIGRLVPARELLGAPL